MRHRVQAGFGRRRLGRIGLSDGRGHAASSRAGQVRRSWICKFYFVDSKDIKALRPKRLEKVRFSRLFGTESNDFNGLPHFTRKNKASVAGE
jgi:hypothetical protein